MSHEYKFVIIEVIIGIVVKTRINNKDNIKIYKLIENGKRKFARLEQLVERKAIEKGAQKEKHSGRVNKFKFKFAGVIEPRNS